ncbi:VOC family protein [Paenibacillus tarimensis]|uniref:VOC family protein n=1 Tax=Paenibacillus tarimensis TaxID=416012 RepID=UPI001F2737B1|nr:VOC family protein [Paenibacillus tarimensis]MCF2945641.1 VOC family protein [Paenibacillus tarimensis]
MKIDHLVVNVDREIQESKSETERFHAMGLPYNPKWGKGTRGFKVSNVWIGKEYFEFVRIKRRDGGGWVENWTEQYVQGHRGLIGFALEVDDIEAVYRELKDRGVDITNPEPLRFRWFFNLLTRTMPWRNAFLPGLKGVPFQFFLQQMNDEKAKSFMEQYMVPNSKENNIHGISEVVIYGQLTQSDRNLLHALFRDCEEQEGSFIVRLDNQMIRFVSSPTYYVEVLLGCGNMDYQNRQVALKNLVIRNT